MLNAGHDAGFMVREKALSTIWAPPAQLSVARTVKLAVPVPVGVPEISPEVLMPSPDGNAPEIMPKLIGG
jgi:hypothetical protein